jgi:sulfur carrier protein ThiS
MKLHAGGYLAFYLPQRRSPAEVRLDSPTRLGEVLAGLGIPLEEVHLAAVNGSLVDLEEALVEDGDTVRVFSAVNGG